MKLSELSYVFVDAQTTGLSASRSELLELGWSLSFDPAQVHSQLVHPAEIEAVPTAVWRVTGLLPKDFSSAANMALVWRHFVDDVAGANPVALVIHYSQFEMPFLKKVDRTIFADSPLSAPLALPVIDTYKIAQRVCPNLPSKTIRALAGHWGFVIPESNRAGDHVVATQLIWKKLIRILETDFSVGTLPELQKWLTSKASCRVKSPSRKSGVPRHYLFSRQSRLALPKAPGVYEMFSSTGQLLYVGKATSLRARVNSYFTQRRSKRSRLHELMTQVADVKVTPTDSPLEAALLENDRIKGHSPPYNVSLRPPRNLQEKPLIFVSSDLNSVSSTPGPDHPRGPFAYEPFETLQQLQAMAHQEWNKVELQWLQHPLEEVHAKLVALLEINQFDPKTISLFDLVRVGKRLLANDAPEDEIEASLQRKLQRAVRALHRTRWLTELSRCQVAFQLSANHWRTLHFQDGVLARAVTASEPEFSQSPRTGRIRRQASMDRRQLDGARILLTELTLFAKKGILFEVVFSNTRSFSGGRVDSCPSSWLSRVGKPLPLPLDEYDSAVAEKAGGSVKQSSP